MSHRGQGKGVARLEVLLPRLAVCLSLWILAACADSGAPSSGAPGATASGAGTEAAVQPGGTADPGGEPGAELAEVPPGRPGLRPIPALGVDQLEAEAQSQLGEGLAALRAVLARPDATDEELGEAYGALGMSSHAYGILAQAEAAYANAAELMPNDPRWMYFLAHVYRELSRLEDSERYFKRTLERGPRYVPTIVWLAGLQLDAGRADDAEATVVRGLQLDQESPAVLFTAGRVAAAQGKADQAIVFFERALELAPEASEINYPLGLAYRAVGDEAKAEQFLAQRGRVRPPLFDPLMEAIGNLKRGTVAELDRGLTALRLNDFAAAETHFEKAIEHDADNVGAYTNLAVAQLRQNRPEEAVATLKAALARKPEHLNANFNLGTILAQLGRDGEALPYYEAVLSADPQHQDAHYNLGNALSRLGRKPEALEHFQRAVSLDPSDSRARQQQVTSLFDLARWDEAGEALESARAALPDDPYLRRLQARFLAAVPDPALRDPERALALAEDLVRSEDSIDHVRLLAMALAAAGRMPEAVAELERALAGAQQSGTSGLVAAINAELALYRAGEAPRSPQSPVMAAPTSVP